MYIVLKYYKTIDSYNITSFSCSSESEATALVAALNLANVQKNDLYFFISF